MAQEENKKKTPKTVKEGAASETVASGEADPKKAKEQVKTDTDAPGEVEALDENAVENANLEEEEEVEEVTTSDPDVNEVVDGDGHTVEDITPWDIDEDDDDETAQNGDEDDPEEYANWDREKLGPMADYAAEKPEDEPVCCGPDDDDVEVGA